MVFPSRRVAVPLRAGVLGLVTVLGRGSLVGEPFAGAPLFETAVEVLGGVVDPPVLVVTGPEEPAVRDSGLSSLVAVEIAEFPAEVNRVRAVLAAAEVVVIHDPMCPLVPPDFIRQLLVSGSVRGAVVGVRPVVDTVKATVGGVVTRAVDRDALRIVSSPAVVATERLAAIPDLTSALSDPGELVRALRSQGDVELVLAPSAARRIEDRSALRLMGSLDAVGRREP